MSPTATFSCKEAFLLDDCKLYTLTLANGAPPACSATVLQTAFQQWYAATAGHALPRLCKIVPQQDATGAWVLDLHVPARCASEIPSLDKVLNPARTTDVSLLQRLADFTQRTADAERIKYDLTFKPDIESKTVRHPHQIRNWLLRAGLYQGADYQAQWPTADQRSCVLSVDKKHREVTAALDACANAYSQKTSVRR